MTSAGDGVVDAPSLIARKRDGGDVPDDDLRALVAGYLGGEVGEEQMAAFLMAGVLRGFSRREAVTLTDILVSSGDQVDLSHLRGPTIDKHSTGGVGDTTTLIVAPVLAACGGQVAKLSGRGLGHTGGTLDKLESIPGMRVDLAADELAAQVEDIGLAVAAATADLVPADKRLYALRDITATVSSPALIASSVMSKKLAGGARHIVLDVKTGDGAFMSEVADAVDLAQLCVDIGEAHGRRTAAVVSDMSQPLGHAVGNAIEVAEAVQVLRGTAHGRLRELSLELAAIALALTGRDPDAARTDAEAALASGDALDRLARMVAAQGGDPQVCDSPGEVLPRAPVVARWTAPDGGVVVGLACRDLGELARDLGAGRRHRGEAVDPAVGLEILVRSGDRVEAGQPLVRVHARRDADAEMAQDRLGGLITIRDVEPQRPPLVHDRLGL